MESPNSIDESLIATGRWEKTECGIGRVAEKLKSENPKIKIGVGVSGNSSESFVEINGVKLQFVQSVRLDMSTNEITVLSLEIAGGADIEGQIGKIYVERPLSDYPTELLSKELQRRGMFPNPGGSEPFGLEA